MSRDLTPSTALVEEGLEVSPLGAILADASTVRGSIVSTWLSAQLGLLGVTPKTHGLEPMLVLRVVCLEKGLVARRNSWRWEEFGRREDVGDRKAKGECRLSCEVRRASALGLWLWTSLSSRQAERARRKRAGRVRRRLQLDLKREELVGQLWDRWA